MDEFEEFLNGKIEEAIEFLRQASRAVLDQVEVAWQLHVEELVHVRDYYLQLRAKRAQKQIIIDDPHFSLLPPEPEVSLTCSTEQASTTFVDYPSQMSPEVLKKRLSPEGRFLGATHSKDPSGGSPNSSNGGPS